MDIINHIKITKLRSKNTIDQYNNVIYGIDYYIVCGVIEHPTKVYTTAGTINLNVSELSQASFVNVDNVDQALVISWILDLENVESVNDLSVVKLANKTLMEILNKTVEETEILVDWNI
jgi:hypothetical protein